MDGGSTATVANVSKVNSMEYSCVKVCVTEHNEAKYPCRMTVVTVSVGQARTTRAVVNTRRTKS